MDTPLNIVPKVIDASHYDDLQDATKVAGAGIVGFVNKASEGPANVDHTFAIRRPVVRSAGMQYGSYHFLRPGDMVQQATHHLNVIGDPTDLLIMADWEVPGIPPHDLKVWLGTIHDKTGQWPVVYSYTSLLLEQLGTTHGDPVLAQCRLWIAKYSQISPGQHPWPTQIWPKPWLWQFTGDGNGPGIHQIPGIVIAGSRGIDVDAYEGGDLHGTDHTDDELRTEWTGGAVKAAPDLVDNDQGDAGPPAAEPQSAPPATPDAAPPAGPTLSDDTAAIVAIANASPIAHYEWRNRGAAPLGYTRGMALAFAQTYRRLKAGHPAAIEMARAISPGNFSDALSWYAGNFAALGMSNSQAGAETLRHLFVLMLGHAMRESSGQHCCGRDRTASNVTSDTAEAGLFQTSYNAHTCHPAFDQLMDEFASGKATGFPDVFAHGVSCSPADWSNYGGGRGHDFQDLCKKQPAFAVESAAIVLRNLRRHYGPINRKEVELRKDADDMFRKVQDHVDQQPATS